jgi:predicted nucleotidyltransferase
VFDRIKIPKTWYITSDSVLEFIRHNNLEDVYDHKYQDIERVRRDYPHLVQVFKNSRFPIELANGIGAALDELGEGPLIVRSSSLLEDQVGAAFSGKYKSLFVANRGTKEERLAALQDAIAEVYASIFAPDPIEYRAERGLLDVHEEMGIMIQQVVGVHVGRYFLPSFAGVAFSRNEFRWSPRILRDDGLVRLVPGLGTRAVDRLSDDYPVLFAPGQPKLPVNVTPDEVIRYSPQKIDVIDLEMNRFQTVDVRDLLREVGRDYPNVRKIVSTVSDGLIRVPMGLGPDWENDELVVNFAGLVAEGRFAHEMHTMLRYLSERLGHPVDLEFACDGQNLYLLQCRAQSASEDFEPSPIPRDLPPEKVIFSARRFVSNGRIPDLTHVVYVDAAGYAGLPSVEDLQDVARAVGKLNKILPRRQFVLVGPGRWGSRGDIKLGVGVGYSDINNSAALVEVASAQGKYTPEPSFGTHFFQDLVEADIRYLPLYPDDEGVIFNERFLIGSESILTDVLPDYGYLDRVLRVIDVPEVAGGQILKILLNADLDEAVAVLSDASADEGKSRMARFKTSEVSDAHWRWRLLMAERIAASADKDRFGVKAMYVIGSAKNATAGPASDIDLIIHFDGDDGQRRALEDWLDGWSRSLAEVNFLRTGYRCDRLLDIHYVTDEDIRKRTSFAAKIGAVTDAARPLKLGVSADPDKASA